MKKETSHYDKNGYLTYYDRKGRKFKVRNSPDSGKDIVEGNRIHCIIKM